MFCREIVLSSPEDISIRESADQIFKRPSLSISPDTLLPQVATFLAIGPQIYVDGIVVTVGKDPIGRIGSKHILQNIIISPRNGWLNTTASELMDRNVPSVDMNSSIGTAMKIFGETRFAFLPLTEKGSLIASLGIRDILSLIINTNIDTSCQPCFFSNGTCSERNKPKAYFRYYVNQKHQKCSYPRWY